MTEEKSLNELLDMDLEALAQEGKTEGKRNLINLLVGILIAAILFGLGLSLHKEIKYQHGLDNLKLLYLDGETYVETVDIFVV